MRQDWIVPFATAAGLLVGLGCQPHHSAPRADGRTVSPAPVETGPSSARLQQALTGLAFDSGRVRVVAALPEDTQPTPGGATQIDNQVRQLLRQGRKRQALEAAVRAVRSSPANGPALTLLSLALRRAGLVDAAAAAARTAIDLQPHAAPPRIALARSLEQSGRYDDALAAWKAVAASTPSTPQVQRRLAALHHLLGDRESAARHAAATAGSNWPLAAGRLADRAERRSIELPVSVGPAVRIDTGGGMAHAAEVSLAATDDGLLVAAWNDLREAGAAGEWRLGWATSDDAGLSWSDGLLRPPGALPGDFEGDPMTAFDPRTGTLWVGGTQFFGDELYLSRRPAGAAEFTAPEIVATGFLDRGQLVAAPDPQQPQTTLLHMAHISGLQTSADFGQTWGAVVAWAESGFAHHPTAGLDGEVYVTYSDFEDRILMQRSLDGGSTLESAVEVAIRMDTWDTQDGSRFPGLFRVAPLPFLASSPVDGTLYCVYFDTTEVVEGQANVDLYLTTSGDRGLTWSLPSVVNEDADPPGDQFHPWIEVDDAGRIHLVFFDSRNTLQDDDVEDGRIDVYHSVSNDSGASWTETRLTSQPFSTDVAQWSVNQLQFLGDYLGLATAGGRTWVAYPTTENGDLDLFVREIAVGELIVADGFESGATTAWTGSSPTAVGSLPEYPAAP